MRSRHFKYWLIIVNLLAFNAYALAAAATLSLPMSRMQPASHVIQQSVNGQACDATSSTHVNHEGMDQSHAHHCDMPCCKDLIEKAVKTNCGCKLDHCGSMQLQDIGSTDHHYLDATFAVDAISTAFTLHDRTQRLLRPPIL